MVYMVLILITNSIKILWHLSVSVSVSVLWFWFWFWFLILKWLVDFSIEFTKGYKPTSR